MTKFLTLILGIAICIPIGATAQGKSYVFEGTINKLSAPATMYLRHDKNKVITIDSSVLKEGHFYFAGKTDPDGTTFLGLSLSGNNGWKSKMRMVRQIYVAPGNSKAYSNDSLKTLHYLTSEINIAQEKLGDSILTLFYGYQKSQKLLASATDPKSKSELIRQVKLDSVHFNDGQQGLIRAFISRFSSSPLALQLVKQHANFSGSAAEAEPLFNLLTPQLKASFSGQEFAKKIYVEKRLSIGKVLPNFTLPDTTGKPVSVTDFRGKYVLVDFWASWCVPCRAENPNVLAAYNIYKANGFTVLSVSLDSPGARNAWLKAVRDDHLPWTQVSDLHGWKSPPAKLFAIDAIPQNYLIGPDGKILGKNLRGKDLEKKLAEIFHASGTMK